MNAPSYLCWMLNLLLTRIVFDRLWQVVPRGVVVVGVMVGKAGVEATRAAETWAAEAAGGAPVVMTEAADQGLGAMAGDVVAVMVAGQMARLHR